MYQCMHSGSPRRLEKGSKGIIEDMMAEIFPNFILKILIYTIKLTPTTLCQMNSRKPITKLIVFKLFKDKEGTH